MIQTLSRNWWLLASSGILCAAFSGACMFSLQPDGSLALRNHATQSALTLLAELAIAAGACTIGASLWKSASGKNWFLALHGVAMIALGLLFSGAASGAAVSFRSIANVYTILAICLGGFAWTAAGKLRVPAFMALAFAVAFLMIRPAPPTDFLWFGSYFAFASVCMLGMAARLHWTHFAPTAATFAPPI